jgi:hypothetical protein
VAARAVLSEFAEVARGAGRAADESGLGRRLRRRVSHGREGGAWVASSRHEQGYRRRAEDGGDQAG